jgi:hypothetical protein
MRTIKEAAPVFTDPDNDVCHCTNGNLLSHGMLDSCCRSDPAPHGGLTLPGLPLTGEVGVAWWVPGRSPVSMRVRLCARQSTRGR